MIGRHRLVVIALSLELHVKEDELAFIKKGYTAGDLHICKCRTLMNKLSVSGHA